MTNEEELARLVHMARLGSDSITLLIRCYEHADMPPALSVDVGNFLLRIQNLRLPHEH